MAQGRGNAFSIAMLLLLFLLGLHQASAVTHTVGASQGWDVNIDYTSWAAGQTFTVGDILFFPFLAPEHNVVVVNKAGYDTCSAVNAIATFSESNANVTLNATGAHYYLCSLPGHCTAGMKLSLTVAAAAAAPLTPPPASPVKAPSSAPKTPTSAPAPASSAGKAPAPVPAPSGTPASAPAPASSPTLTPSAGTPASSPAAPGSSPSTAGTPPSTSSPPNSAPPLLASAGLSPLLAFVISLFFAF